MKDSSMKEVSVFTQMYCTSPNKLHFQSSVGKGIKDTATKVG